MACPFAILSINGEGSKCPVGKVGEKPKEEVTAKSVDETAGEQCERKNGGEKTGGGKCPFGFDKKASTMEVCEAKGDAHAEAKKSDNISGQCPFGYGKSEGSKESHENGVDEQGKERKDENTEASAGGKCPLGYDSVSFKIGPFSCVLCRALLHDSSRCVPCRHIFCRGCISRFQDCPLCGLDIENIESDPEMQGLVDRFIEGHARIKRPTVQSGAEEASAGRDIKYEDISVERGSFLVQQAMRAFQGNNLESAKARLGLCIEDSREEMSRSGATSTNCSQLGALLGMLGDCCGAMKDVDGAIASYEESVELLTKLPDRDIEVLILITTLYCQLCPSLGRVNARQSSIGIPDPPMLRIIDMKRCLYL
uniref:RING-type domain-containing protein n=1 Tax=Physcomitrium patens TaxID=3218 RepID=A0A7I4DI66_PHYPA